MPLDRSVPPGGVTGSPNGISGVTGTTSNLTGDWQSEAALKLDGRGGNTRRDSARPAKAADLTAGAEIADNKGVEVGYIKSIDTDGVVVATAAGQVKVPAEALGRNSKGLLIGMSKADFDKLVAQAVGG